MKPRLELDALHDKQSDCCSSSMLWFASKMLDLFGHCPHDRIMWNVKNQPTQLLLLLCHKVFSRPLAFVTRFLHCHSRKQQNYIHTRWSDTFNDIWLLLSKVLQRVTVGVCSWYYLLLIWHYIVIAKPLMTPIENALTIPNCVSCSTSFMQPPKSYWMP